LKDHFLLCSYSTLDTPTWKNNGNHSFEASTIRNRERKPALQNCKFQNKHNVASRHHPLLKHQRDLGSARKQCDKLAVKNIP